MKKQTAGCSCGLDGLSPNLYSGSNLGPRNEFMMSKPVKNIPRKPISLEEY